MSRPGRTAASWHSADHTCDFAPMELPGESALPTTLADLKGCVDTAPFRWRSEGFHSVAPFGHRGRRVVPTLVVVDPPSTVACGRKGGDTFILRDRSRGRLSYASVGLDSAARRSHCTGVVGRLWVRPVSSKSTRRDPTKTSRHGPSVARLWRCHRIRPLLHSGCVSVGRRLSRWRRCMTKSYKISTMNVHSLRAVPCWRQFL